jgi:hypothetical protein
VQPSESLLAPRRPRQGGTFLHLLPRTAAQGATLAWKVTCESEQHTDRRAMQVPAGGLLAHCAVKLRCEGPGEAERTPIPTHVRLSRRAHVAPAPGQARKAAGARYAARSSSARRAAGARARYPSPRNVAMPEDARAAGTQSRGHRAPPQCRTLYLPPSALPRHRVCQPHRVRACTGLWERTFFALCVCRACVRRRGDSTSLRPRQGRLR